MSFRHQKDVRFKAKILIIMVNPNLILANIQLLFQKKKKKWSSHHGSEVS